MYCAQTDLLERIAQETLVSLTDDGEAGEVDASVVARAIADADSEIDGYVGTRHAVPLSPVPDLIRKVSVELAIYHLYSRRMGAPEEWRQRYADNVRLLRDVSAGKVSLGASDPAGTPVAKPVLYDGPARVFSRENPGGHVVPIAAAITTDLAGAQSWLHGIKISSEELTPVLKDFAEYMVGSIKRNFAAGGRPRKWKPSHRALATGGKTLVKSGRLRSSMGWRVAYDAAFVGTNVAYGRAHQFGVNKSVSQSVRAHSRRSRTGRQHEVRAHVRRMRLRLPARPFLKVQREDRRYMNASLRKHFLLRSK